MYTPIIGMEIHVELKTNTKMFCGCENNPEKAPNTNICEVCVGHPGALPVPNKAAITAAVLIGKALGCTIRTTSKFDRKHYFYPDLPKGYQISQFDEPIAEYGSITLSFPIEDNIRDTAIIGIRRAHLEEDTAKLFHNTDGTTLVDFNRSSVPLVEIVTNPDFKSALEAKTFCQELQHILRYLNVSDADMEKGHMRCEVNISVQKTGSFEIQNGAVLPLNGATLNNKIEIKNLNSFKAVEKSIQHEIIRQTALIETNTYWPQETRGWDGTQEVTVPQRIKENAADYRYMPEPDIPCFHPEIIAQHISLPELPIQKRARFKEEYAFSYSDAKVVTDTKELAAFTEATMTELHEWIQTLTSKEPHKEAIGKLTGGWITTKLLGTLYEQKKDISSIAMSPENFAELIALLYTKKINATNAQKILLDMIQSPIDKDPTHIMEEQGYAQIDDNTSLQTAIEHVIATYPEQVTAFRQGKDSIIKFLIGMVMKETNGSANAQKVETLLRETLQ